MISKVDSIASLYGAQSKVVPVTEGANASPSLSSLIQGKIASATVEGNPSQNIFTLKLAGQSFNVQSQLPLQKGEQVQFQVLRTEPVLELQKVDPALPAQIRQNLSLVGEVIDVKPLLQNLQSSFYTTAKSSPLSQLLQPLLTPSSQGNAQASLQALPSALQQAGVQQLGLQQVGVQSLNGTALQQLLDQGSYEAKATVLSNLGQDTKLIRIGGETYPLHGPLRTAVGDTQTLRLQSLQPTVNFFPVDGGGSVDKSIALLLQTPAQSLPALARALQLPVFTGLDLLHQSQQQLLETLRNMKPASLQTPGAGEVLKTALEQLGMRSEALVASGREKEAAGQLKSVLADIAGIFKGQDEISATASRLLATIENSQLLQAHFQNENSILFPLFFSFLEQGYLSVDRDGTRENKEDVDSKEDLACTVHLKMEGLGNIRIRCVQNKEAVRVAFFLDSQEKVEFVESFAGELTSSVSSAPLLSLSFATGAESPGVALIQNVLAAEQPILNTSV
jgi:hypothetical protein